MEGGMGARSASMRDLFITGDLKTDRPGGLKNSKGEGGMGFAEGDSVPP